VCDCQWTRREAIGRAIGLAALTAAVGAATTTSTTQTAGASAAPARVMPGLVIQPRDAWGADLPPKAPSRPETPRFLLVHHTASSNTYRSARDVIRSTYAWQTSAAKGWSDVCYQFFVGRDGDVWEGRAGALTRPVVADATGGSQGWAQLVCLLGDFSAAQPTTAAYDSLVRVLAWLALRDQLDVRPDATTTFVSRGSQRWPAGTVVSTPTIAAHRDMSYTACPGDAFVPRLPDLRTRVAAQVTAWNGVLMPAVRLGLVQ
jgi:hypothetical protein